MGKPIDLALKEAVAAHKENKLQKARQLYDAILKAQPDHPDANYHLASFILATDNPEAAIPLFKKATKAKPRTEQYWLAYIEGLLIANKLDETLAALSEAKLCGISPRALHGLKKKAASYLVS